MSAASAAAAEPPSTPPEGGRESPPMKIKGIGPYTFLKTLGKGSTGKVKLAEHNETHQKVAIKIIERSILAEKPILQRVVIREIGVMKLLSHPHVIRLQECLENEDSLFLVMECASGGEIFDYLMKKKLLDEDEACTFFQQLIAGLDYCHHHNICHRDIKPENLLLDHQNRLKIADFGMASIVRPDHLQTTSCGSPHFAAPEVVEGKGNSYDGRTADVWSSGVVLYALLTGCLPFHHDNVHKLLRLVRRADFRMPPHVSDAAKHLLGRMLTKDPAVRITLSEIRQHPWFTRRPVDLYMFTTLTLKLASPIRSLTSISATILETFRNLGWKDDEELLQALSVTDRNTERLVLTLLQTYEMRVQQSVEPKKSAAIPVRRISQLSDSHAEARMRSGSVDTAVPLLRNRLLAERFQTQSSAMRAAGTPLFDNLAVAQRDDYSSVGSQSSTPMHSPRSQSPARTSATESLGVSPDELIQLLQQQQQRQRSGSNPGRVTPADIPPKPRAGRRMSLLTVSLGRTAARFQSSPTSPDTATTAAAFAAATSTGGPAVPLPTGSGVFSAEFESQFSSSIPACVPLSHAPTAPSASGLPPIGPMSPKPPQSSAQSTPTRPPHLSPSLAGRSSRITGSPIIGPQSPLSASPHSSGSSPMRALSLATPPRLLSPVHQPVARALASNRAYGLPAAVTSALSTRASPVPAPTSSLDIPVCAPALSVSPTPLGSSPSSSPASPVPGPGMLRPRSLRPPPIIVEAPGDDTGSSGKGGTTPTSTASNPRAWFDSL